MFPVTWANKLGSVGRKKNWFAIFFYRTNTSSQFKAHDSCESIIQFFFLNRSNHDKIFRARSKNLRSVG
jgi:hypothetical protein